MPFPVHVLDRNDFANADDASFAITGGDFVGRIQVDDVLI